MTWWILLILVFMFIVLVWHSAIHHALLDTPDSVLERHLAQNGRLERDRWLIGKQRGLAALAAMMRKIHANMCHNSPLRHWSLPQMRLPETT